MKKIKKLSPIFLFCLLFGTISASNELYSNFVYGDAGIESISALTLGPDGILFVGDSHKARVVALRTDDNNTSNSEEGVSVDKVDLTIASLLGRDVSEIRITDMVANPVSRNIYFGIEMNDASPVILKYSNGEFSSVDLKYISHSSIDLKNAVETDAKDRRGRSLRRWAISDLQFYKGNVLVSGLSNEEFSSTLRSMPFPFAEKQKYSSIEIYHAAHGRYETYAPVKTFMPYELNGKDHIVASFTCTPLVIFPMDELQPGNHAKGRTVAELGNRNTPLDILEYKKDGKPFLLLANSSRALMKIDPSKVESYRDYLSSPVEGSSETAGVHFLAMPYTNVLQMDKMAEDEVVLLQRKSDGDLDLDTVASNRL